MKNYFFMLFLATGTIANAAPFTDGNSENGKRLFAQYECSSCHEGKMGGDGSAIFTRPDHKVRSAADLIPQIKFCSGMVGAHLTPQEEQDLAAHLNQTYYHFK
ncbi:c-type cytochrome [Ferrigenium sp. UT5]|uniref:c-type cytochrome n=1 Tax=Ferrigenium sp. UT5 TaxID=3242105 RepID=UPI00355419EB